MKIARIIPMTYTPGKLEYASFIRGGIGADYHQEPRFFQFPDGQVMMYWAAYDFDECASNLVKLYSITKDRGLTWSDPQVYMANYPEGVPYFVCMLQLRTSGKALMLHTQTRHNIEVDEADSTFTAHSDYFKSQTRIFIRRSADNGITFDHGEELPYLDISGGKSLPGVGFYGSIDELIQLQSGRIAVAFSYLDPDRSDSGKGLQHYTAVCLLSDDEGRTWRRSGEITCDTPRGVMEVQIVETAPDRLYCLFRTKGGYLYQTVSEDGGENWQAAAPSMLPAPESMARMIKLQSGSLLVIWNNISSTTQQPRHPLVAAISRDGGRTWGDPRIIAREAGTNQLSNHGVIQLDDGRILLGISHYRDIRPMTSDLDMAIFDEAWLQDLEGGMGM
ncbi:sialidase family protein [Paenibacillus eucommiae]|uniref:Sialidase domain-containing protein n=1 Tax=Paenibacillus eucommiae TaxID=1355755 RepID=A0ABS4ITQ7_9BACL|nr:sialidase family protein [Paenibacillus eucommiae]MBP1990406.1 hypothetical protein [Paenibacillus eucommiae]